MIGIIDYGMGNVGSIKNILRKVGAKADICATPDQVAQAQAVILPGVGHFGRAMQEIGERDLMDALHKKVMEDKVPTLGICLGMQLLGKGSAEAPDAKGFGWIDAHCERFNFETLEDKHLRVPHMGWNTVDIKKPSPLFDDDGLEEHRYYFVHSYHMICTDESDVLCSAHHGYDITAAIARDNITGCQFHPEKSHKFGMSLFRRWVSTYMPDQLEDAA